MFRYSELLGTLGWLTSSAIVSIFGVTHRSISVISIWALHARSGQADRRVLARAHNMLAPGLICAAGLRSGRVGVGYPPTNGAPAMPGRRAAVAAALPRQRRRGCTTTPEHFDARVGRHAPRDR